MSRSLLLSLVIVLMACSSRPEEDENFLENLMKTQPENFRQILANKDSLEIQIIYSQINRDAKNVPSFRQFRFNVDSLRYFYPASTSSFRFVCLRLIKSIH